MSSNKNCTAVFYHRTTDVVLLCLLLAVLPQMVGMNLFVAAPQANALIDLAMYVLGVLLGCLMAVLALRCMRSHDFSSGKSALFITCRISERQLFWLTLVLFLPLLPDSLLAFVMSQQQVNVRYSLLTDPSLRILDPKWIMLIGRGVFLLLWFHLIFVKPKTVWITIGMFVIYIFMSFIWASRTEFMLLGVLYVVNARRLITRTNILLLVFLALLMSFYTIVIQGRGGMPGYAGYVDATLFYSVYFAYPLYLYSAIPKVFKDLSIPYALLGYPVDVLETYFAVIPGVIARHLDEIATYSYIGLDLRGKVHEKANVLYPHYGLIGVTMGHLGVLTYYMVIVFLVCLSAEYFRKYALLWRVLVFVLIWESARGFSLGTPNYWFMFGYAVLFTLAFVKSARLVPLSMADSLSDRPSQSPSDSKIKGRFRLYRLLTRFQSVQPKTRLPTNGRMACNSMDIVDNNLSLSIITVVLNDPDGLRRTQDSLRRQTIQPEWIVVDGHSSEATQAVLSELPDTVHWISERDDGIYDAMNKGLQMAKGDFVVFLNAGDSLSDEGVVADVLRYFGSDEGKGIDVLCGGANLVLADGRKIYRGPKVAEKYIWHGLPANHQATYYRRLMLGAQPYDIRFGICGDYFLAASLFTRNATFGYLDQPVVEFFLDGISYGWRRNLFLEPYVIQRDVLSLGLDQRILSLLKRLVSSSVLHLLELPVVGIGLFKAISYVRSRR